MYRTLQQTVNLAIAEHGAIESWDFKAGMSNEEKDAFVKKYLLSHLNVMKFCPTDNSVKGCAVDSVIKRKDNTNWVNWNEYSQPKVVLADGSSILFHLDSSGVVMNFYFDVNGHKKPNIIGDDIFYFNLKTDGSLLPGWHNHSREDILNNCKNGTGMACATMIIQDGFKITY